MKVVNLAIIDELIDGMVIFLEELTLVGDIMCFL